MEVALEMSSALGVIPDAVLVALEPHVARVQGRHSYPGVEQRFILQGNLCAAARWPPAVLLDLAQLLQGVPKVFGLLRPSETPGLEYPKALLAFGFPGRHQAALQGVPHRHGAA